MSGGSPAHGMPAADRAADRLWGILPAEKLVGLGDLGRLRAAEPVLSPAFRAALVDGNPWLRALRRLGLGLEIDERAIPIEEGETSLNANSYQVLTALLPAAAAAGQGWRPTVVGTVVAGNHGLLHALERFAASFADRDRVRRALLEVLGDAALQAAAPLLAGLPRQTAKSFSRLPVAVRRLRALRLPGCLVPAPEPDRLRRLCGALRLHPRLAAELWAAREALDEAGLDSVASYLLLVRATLLQRLAGMLGLGTVNHLPCTLEHAVLHAAGEDFPGRTIRELARRYVDALRAAQVPGPREPRVRSGRFRVLNHYDPAELLRLGGKRAGRRALYGWRTLKASYDSGDVAGAGEAEALADLSVREALSRGYGLSGKLTYLAVREINGGTVCNQVLRGLPDVYASLADPAHPGLVMPLGVMTIYGAWQLRSSPQLDAITLVDWLYRCRRPEAMLRRIFELFHEHSRDARQEPQAAIVLESPGAFTLR